METRTLSPTRQYKADILHVELVSTTPTPKTLKPESLHLKTLASTFWFDKTEILNSTLDPGRRARGCEEAEEHLQGRLLSWWALKAGVGGGGGVAGWRLIMLFICRPHPHTLLQRFYGSGTRQSTGIYSNVASLYQHTAQGYGTRHDVTSVQQLLSSHPELCSEAPSLGLEDLLLVTAFPTPHASCQSLAHKNNQANFCHATLVRVVEAQIHMINRVKLNHRL